MWRDTPEWPRSTISRDNRFQHYDEPDRMREYAIRRGVPARDVAADYAGRRTYDSIYRANRIFGLDHFVIVSQGFHLDRAIYICKRLHIDAWGFSADRPGHHTSMAVLRELPASLAALVDTTIRRPRPVMGKREKI